MKKDGNRNVNPYRRKAESEELSIPEENRMVILGIIDTIEEMKEDIKKLKEEIGCQSK